MNFNTPASYIEVFEVEYEPLDHFTSDKRDISNISKRIIGSIKTWCKFLTINKTLDIHNIMLLPV